jgi:hypothetical protein
MRSGECGVRNKRGEHSTFNVERRRGESVLIVFYGATQKYQLESAGGDALRKGRVNSFVGEHTHGAVDGYPG